MKRLKAPNNENQRWNSLTHSLTHTPESESIYREILLRLPAVSLFRLRAVSKGWCSVIDDPSFIKAHTDHQQQQLSTSTFIFRNSTGPPFAALYHIDAEDLDGFTDGLQTIHVTPLKLTRTGLSRLKALPVSACHGLLLCAPLLAKKRKYQKKGVDKNWKTDGVWEIRNPLTQERLKLPRLNTKKNLLGTGLGYDCSSDDYKVVVIEVKRKIEKPSRTHVYSLRSDLWRTIANYPTGDKFWGCYKGVENGVFLNGSLLWFTDKGIIVFDVGTENYLQQLLPLPFIKWMGQDCQHLDVVSERLFLGCSYWDGWDEEGWHCYSFDLWVMNDYGAKDYSWTKVFTLERTNLFVLRPVAYIKNERFVRVLLQDDKEFVWFDEKSKTTKSIKMHAISDYNYSSQVFIGSLFRLHDSCGRVAPASRTNRRRMWNVKMASAHTKRPTFCVRDYYDSSCTNWYHGSPGSAKRIKVCGRSSFDPHGVSFTLPPDICRDIFLRFPPKSVIQFRAVCKDWRAVIDDPCFVKAHTNKHPAVSKILIRNSTGPPFYPLYSFDLAELDLEEAFQTITATPHEFTGTSRSFPCLPVHGCNGLMLISDDDDDKKLQLWNPLTGEHLELPQVREFNSTIRVLTHAVGLGYDQTTDDYKVVAIQRERGDNCKVHGTHVYSLRADSWKRIGECPCWYLSDGPGVFLCGALHWFSSLECGEHTKIIALDLTTESYRQLKGPLLGRGRTDLDDGKRCLDVLGDCLIMTDFGKYNRFRDYHYDVWVMKDYGSEDSWIKLFSIDDPYVRRKFCLRPKHLRPITYMKNETQILLQDEIGFYLFDVKSASVKKRICIHGLTQHLSSQIFQGSIFRLHDNCGKRRTRKRIMKRPLTDTELYFCVRDGHPYSYFEFDSDSNSDPESDFYSHDSCYTKESNWYYSSSENED